MSHGQRDRGRSGPSLSGALARVARLPWIAVALGLALWMGAHTETARDLLANALTAASGGRILVQGLGGELPFRPRIEQFELTDADGAWLRAENVAAVLSPGALLSGELDINALTVDRLELLRLPEAESSRDGGIQLPLSGRLRRLVVAQLFATALDDTLPPFVATGSGRLAAGSTDADLFLTLLADRDRLALNLQSQPAANRLAVTAHGTKDGRLSALAQSALGPLPLGLDDWNLTAQAQGPLDAFAVGARLAVGPHRGELGGMVDLPGRGIDLLEVGARLAGTALRPAKLQGRVAWDAVDASVTLFGPMSAPRGTLQSTVRGLTLSHDEEPDGGPAITSEQSEARPDAHPVWLGGGLKLEGAFDLGDTPRIAAIGRLTPTQVPTWWQGLIGDTAQLSLRAGRSDSLLAIDHALLETEQITLEAAGRLGAGLLDLSWGLDLRAPSPLGSGAGVDIVARGVASGTPMAPRIAADLDLHPAGVASTALESAATVGSAPGKVQGHLLLEPMAPHGELMLAGRWWGEPTSVALRLAPTTAGGIALHLDPSRWSGVQAEGYLERPAGASLPTGRLQLDIARLEEVTPLLATLLEAWTASANVGDWINQIGGQLAVHTELQGDQGVRVAGNGRSLRLPLGVDIGGLSLAGSLRDPMANAQGDARVTISELRVGGVVGGFELRASGPLDAVKVDADAELDLGASGSAGAGKVRFSTAGALDLEARRLGLARIRLATTGAQFRLLAPAVVDFGAGVTLSPVRLGLSTEGDADPAVGAGARSGGVLEIGGQISPSLSLAARLDRLDLDKATAWLPRSVGSHAGAVQGIVDAEARLAGTLAAPTGNLSLSLNELALTAAARLGLPPAAARLTMNLQETAARLEAQAWIDERARLIVDGRIGGTPWAEGAALDLRGRGHVDLALLDARLAVAGRRVEGRVDLEFGVGGTRAAPKLGGGLGLTDASWTDRRLGVSIDSIRGSARLSENGLSVDRLAARAGSGSLELGGRIDWVAPGRPVDLRLRARDAEPVELDQLWLRGDADLNLIGGLGSDLRLAGDVQLSALDIQIPERMPAAIPTLDVVEIGERRQPRPGRGDATASPWRPRLQLDVRLDAPSSIKVRGSNIDAELGGAVHLRGSAAKPIAEGGFALLRGEYRLIGQSLRFDRGRIGLDATSLLNPTLDFEARSTSRGATAILAVEGRAQAPVVVLRGEPPMSDDEVLSRLLFGVPPQQLSAYQLGRLGLAAASVADVGIDGIGLLERADAALAMPGLRLDSDRDGETVLEGRRDLTERVFLGARQGLFGGDPRAVLGLKLAPQIRFESDVGAGRAGAGAAFELEY